MESAISHPRTSLRLLMTADTVGGVWTYALDLARGLGGLGVEVMLATMGAALSSEQKRAAAAIEHLVVHESEYPLEWMSAPWRGVDAAGEWLLELEERWQPDLVQINGYSHAALPFSAPVVSVAHSCVCTWWLAVHGEDAPAEWNRYRRRVAAGIAGADVLVAPTRAILRAIVEAHGGETPSAVIYNGRGREGYAPARPKEPCILSAGRLWDRAKNLAALDACAAKVPWPIYVAGPTEHPDGGQSDPREVRLLGSLPPAELARWMGRSAIYCLPARYEPFGLSALEAAISGCALVLGDIPTLREVWGAAALYVAPDDVDALSDVLRALASDRSRTSEMAARAQRRALRFSVSTMAEHYRALYDNLLEKAQPGSLAS